MKIRSCNSVMAEVALTSEELNIINNSLNEVCNGIELEGEFDTRMGCTVEEARNLLHAVHTLILDMKKSH
jgi:hypothetical protein